MARIDPVSYDSVPDELRPYVEMAEHAMGFQANDVLTMTRIPPVLKALAELAPVMYLPGTVSLELKNMVTLMTSASAGCYYCSAHQTLGSEVSGNSEEKIRSIWEYHTSELFTDAERAALRVAHHAGLTPNATTEEDFEDLKRHFSDEQILEIVAVISMFGFLNRWNDTLKTDLERQPGEAGEKFELVTP